MFSLTRPTTIGPWRVASIAAVALLAAGIGVAAGAFLLGNRTALGPAAAYVPGDTPLYLELRVTPSDAQDAALRQVLERFGPIDGLDTTRPLHDQLTERLDEMLAAENVELTWAADVAPWFDGRVAIAVSDLSGSMGVVPDAMELPTSAPAVVMLGVTDAAAADAAIGRILGTSGAPTFVTSQHGAATVHVANGDQPAAFVLTDDQLILGTGEADVVAMLDAHADPGTTLARRDGLGAMAAALPSDWLAFAVFDNSSMVDSLRTDLAGLGELGPIADALAAVFEHQPQRGAMAISVAGDRLLVDVASELPTGPFAVDNADRGLAANVPATALVYAEAVNLGQALSGILTPITDALADDPDMAEGLELAEGVLGGDISELVSWIDDAAFVAGTDGASPYVGLVVSPSSMDAAERRLEQLATFAGLGGMDPSSPMTVTTSDVDGIEVTTLRIAGDLPLPDAPIDVPSDIVIEWAMTANRVLIGFGDSFVSDSIRLASGDSLAAQSRFTDALGSLGGTSHAGTTWVDVGGLIAAFGDLAGASGSDLARLDALDAFVSVSRVEGNLLVARTALLLD